jgi:hypothetical protein
VKKDTLKEVDFKTFLERVAENVTRRALKEKDDIGDSTVLRQISAHFEKSNGQFRLLLDMVSRPTLPLTPRFIEKNVLPLVAQQVSELFKSYRFKDFDGITVIEKNTGKIFTQSS